MHGRPSCDGASSDAGACQEYSASSQAGYGSFQHDASSSPLCCKVSGPVTPKLSSSLCFLFEAVDSASLLQFRNVPIRFGSVRFRRTFVNWNAVPCGSALCGSIPKAKQILAVPPRFVSALPQFQRGSVRFGCASRQVWIVELGVSVQENTGATNQPCAAYYYYYYY